MHKLLPKISKTLWLKKKILEEFEKKRYYSMSYVLLKISFATQINPVSFKNMNIFTHDKITADVVFYPWLKSIWVVFY